MKARLIRQDFENAAVVDVPGDAAPLVLIVKYLAPLTIERTIYTYTGRVTRSGVHLYVEADAKEITL
jgi:hypothetical protein